MIALKNILVATDFGHTAAAALAYGRELARQYQGHLHVFHALDDLQWRYSLDMSPGLLVGIQEDLEEGARQRMTALLTDEDRTQLHAVGMISPMCPDPAEAIVEYARRAAVDVIVIGTHGRRGMSRLFLGSVAERVVRTAPCPVLTVRQRERAFLTAEEAIAEAAPALM